MLKIVEIVGQKVNTTLVTGVTAQERESHVTLDQSTCSLQS